MGTGDGGAGVAGIGGHAAGEIDGADFGAGEGEGEFDDEFGGAAAGVAIDAGAEQRVDDEGGAAGFVGDLVVDGFKAAGAEHLEVGGGVATEFGGFGGEDDIERGEAVADVKETGDGETVTAVVAFAAEDEHALFAERGALAFEDFDDAVGGVLHEDEAGDAGFDGAAIDLAHFGGGEDLHANFSSMSSSRRRSCAGWPMTIK